MILTTFEVSLAADATVILARRLVQRDANPRSKSRYLRNWTYKGNHASASITIRKQTAALRNGNAWRAIGVSRVTLLLENDIQ